MRYSIPRNISIRFCCGVWAQSPWCLVITNRWLARIEFSAFLASGTLKAPDAHDEKLSTLLGRLAVRPQGVRNARGNLAKSPAGYASAGTPDQLALLVCVC